MVLRELGLEGNAGMRIGGFDLSRLLLVSRNYFREHIIVLKPGSLYESNESGIIAIIVEAS
jgi:hypothetical protein